MTAFERFWRFVQKTDTCWLWTGGTDRKGYGRFRDGKLWRAHRWSYTKFVGSIPEGMQTDHSCNTPGCVRPDHLTLVTNKRNQELKAERIEACPHGHPWDKMNTRIKQTASGGTQRVCRACHREAERVRRSLRNVNV